MKPRWASRTRTIALLVSALMLGSLGGTFGPLSKRADALAPATPWVQVGASVTDTTLGPNTQLDTITMVKPGLAYAVGSSPGVAGGRFYLMRSLDVGRSWSVKGVMPFPSLVHPNDYEAPITLDFINASTGYASIQGGALFVTIDAGTSWTKVRAPGTSPSFAITAGHVFVVSNVCRAQATSANAPECTNELTAFHVGSGAPLRSEPVAHAVATGPSSTAILLAAIPTGRLVVQEGAPDSGHIALASTTDGGVHWMTLANPCQGLSDIQILTSRDGATLLYCYGAGGMNQGTSELWSSRDALTNWNLVAKADEAGTNIGQISDVFNTLHFSNDGKVLFGALGGASGGLEFSTDSGAHWRRVDLPLAWYGGVSEYLSPYGPSGAVFGVQGGPQFKTTDATSWTQLPQLRAGTYRGLSICTHAMGTNVHRSTTMTGIPATTLDYPIVFSNTSSVACYLNGVPAVQPLSGGAQRSVGGRAYPVNVQDRGGFVILNAHGGTASIVVESDALAPDQRRACSAKVMTALAIRFNPPASFFVATPARAVCEGGLNVRNSGIAPGVTTWIG